LSNESTKTQMNRGRRGENDVRQRALCIAI